MENFPEWGDRLTDKTHQILPPYFFYFKNKDKNKNGTQNLNFA